MKDSCWFLFEWIFLEIVATYENRELDKYTNILCWKLYNYELLIETNIREKQKWEKLEFLSLYLWNLYETMNDHET